MVGLTLGVGAIIAIGALIAAGPKVAGRRIGGALVGFAVGFLIGVVVDEAIGLMHWFGPVDVPDPVIQMFGIATTIGTLYPAMFGVVGVVVGFAVAGGEK